MAPEEIEELLPQLTYRILDGWGYWHFKSDSTIALYDKAVETMAWAVYRRRQQCKS